MVLKREKPHTHTQNCLVDLGIPGHAAYLSSFFKKTHFAPKRKMGVGRKFIYIHFLFGFSFGLFSRAKLVTVRFKECNQPPKFEGLEFQKGSRPQVELILSDEERHLGPRNCRISMGRKMDGWIVFLFQEGTKQGSSN